MSVVILGGNDCMKRRYLDACEERGCKAKCFIKMTQEIIKKMGKPDLVVLFTNTVSHKVMNTAVAEAKKQKIAIERSHTASLAALTNILDAHCLPA